MEYKDYYKILGVPRTASEAEIKRAYRKLAREFHPDRNQAKDAEDRFKAANEANEVLGDPKKRAAYDQLGPNWQNGQRFTPPPGWGGGGRGGMGGGAGGGDFSDFFSTLFGGNAGGAGGFDQGGAGFGGPPRDQQASLSIALEDSYSGATRNISIGNRTLNVRIPKGVASGQSIRLPGQAPRGGDLLLEVTFSPHPLFKPEGRDLHMSLNVAPWEAALGQSVPVQTLGGTVELNLPAGTLSGRRLRLKGRGLPGSPDGDQFVTIQVQTPAPETDAQRQVYEHMQAQFPNFDPRARSTS